MTSATNAPTTSDDDRHVEQVLEHPGRGSHRPGGYNVLLDSQAERHLGSIEHLFVFVARVGLDQTEGKQLLEQVLDIFGREVLSSLLPMTVATSAGAATGHRGSI